jgi:hypothetical protein
MSPTLSLDLLTGGVPALTIGRSLPLLMLPAVVCHILQLNCFYMKGGRPWQNSVPSEWEEGLGKIFQPCRKIYNQHIFVWSFHSRMKISKKTSLPYRSRPFKLPLYRSLPFITFTSTVFRLCIALPSIYLQDFF